MRVDLIICWDPGAEPLHNEGQWRIQGDGPQAPTSLFRKNNLAGYCWIMHKNVRMKKRIHKNVAYEEFLVRRTELKRGLDKKVET